MPIDRVKLTDGSTLDYYVPVGVSVEESTSIYAPAAVQKVEMGVDPLEPPETTLGGYVSEVGKGLASGAAGLVESAATGAAFLLPEEQEQAARKAIAEKGAQVQAGLQPAAGYEDTVARKFAEATGSTAPFIATGAFGGLGALAARAALGTGVGLGAAAGAGEAAKRAEAAGATEEQISKAAGLGLIPGLGETLVPFAVGKSIRAGMAARGLGKSLGEAPAGDALSRLRRVATAAGGEGLQEASAEIAQNLISQGVYDPETGTFTGTGESLGYGAGVGGLLAALAELASPGRARGTRADAPTDLSEGELAALPQASVTADALPDEELTPEQERDRIAEFDRGEKELFAIEGEIEDSANRKDEGVFEEQEQLFPDLEPTKQAEGLVALGVNPNAPIIKRIKDKQLSDPVQRREVFDELQKYARNKKVKPETRNRIGNLLQSEVFEGTRLDVTAGPGPAPQQVTIEEGIEQDARREETSDQRAREFALAEAARRPNVPTAVGAALQAAEATGRRVPDQAQLEIPTIEAADPTVQAIAAEQRRIENQPAQAEAGVAPEQGALLGPRGGPRTSIGTPAAPTTSTPVAEQLFVPNPASINPVPDPQGVVAASEASAEELATADMSKLLKAANEYNDRVAEEVITKLLGPEKAAEYAKLRSPSEKQLDWLAENSTDVFELDVEVDKRWANTDRLESFKKYVGVYSEASPKEMGKSISKLFQKAGNADFKSTPEYAGILSAFNYAAEQGWNAGEVIAGAKIGAKQYAGMDFQELFPELFSVSTPNLEPDVESAAAVAADEGDIDADVIKAEAEVVSQANPEAQAERAVSREEDSVRVLEEVVANPKGPASKYFKGKTLVDGIDALAADMSTGLTTENVAAQEWVKANLSVTSRRELSDTVRTMVANEKLQLPAASMAVTSQPLSQQIRIKLDAGDLRGAINDLTQSTNQTISRVATAIEQGLGNTKVVMASNVVNPEGKTVAGLYDPKTDTITLNQDVDLKNHVLLHESMHAVTSHEIAKNTPAAQQMRNLFESVKDRLDTAYGATNLDEFVAEAFSNPEFQAKLGRITAKGEKISMWSKFKNIVNNMVRRYRGQPSKTLESAMDKADRLVKELISPAPESRDGAKLYSATVEGTEKATLNSLGRFAKGKLREEDVATVSGYFAAASTTTKNAMSQILPLNALYKIAQNKYPLIAEQAQKLFKLLQTKNGDRQGYLKKIKDTADVIEQKIGKNKKVKEMLADWVAQSTIERTDPTKPRTDYLGDTAKLEAWDLMHSLLDERNLDATQRKNLIAGYKTLRDSYSTVYKELVSTMDTRLSAIEDDGVRQSLRDRLLTQLLQNETIEPYFPLYRKGSHWLFYKAIDPVTGRPEIYKESFESKGARNKARNLLENIDGVTDIEVYQRVKGRGFGQVDTQFAFDLLGKARKQGMSKELEATLLDSLFDIMPERSLIRSFKQRENTLGFERDPLKVFRERMPNFTNQIINLRHDLALSKISTDLNEATNQYRTPDEADFDAVQNLNETFQGYVTFARNPNISSLSKMAKTLGFGWTLGFNVSSVLANASNLPIVVLPYLGGRYGFTDAMKAMNDARKLFMGTGMKRRTETFTGEGETEVFEGPSMSNIDFSDPNLSQEQRELETLSILMGERGQSNISTTAENLDMENPANSAWTYANNTMGWMFHQGERANRQITAITSYKLELAKRAKKSKLTEQDYKEAAEIALEDTEITNSGAMIETAPRVSQSNMGNWMTMYKRFGISMYYLQFQMAKQAISRAKTSEERAEAKWQIVGLFASSALFAGVQGLPLYGAVSFIANNVFLDDEDEDFDSIAASYLNEGMYSGALNAIFGVDIAPRIGMSNLIYRAQPNRAEQDILLDIAEFVGGPVLGVGRRVISGGKLIAEGEVYRGTERVLPSVLANGFKALRYGTEGATTLRGDPIMEDINAWNIFAQSLGLSPAGYTKQLEINARDKGVDRRVNTKRTKLMGDYYLAAREGDIDGATELVQEMIEFSERNPYVAISGDSLERSMRQHSVTDEIAKQLGGIPANRRAMKRILLRRMQDMGDVP